MDDAQYHWQRVIGVQIRKLRKEAGLTLVDLSRLSGVAVPALSLIETGNRDVRLSTLVRLAEALRVDLIDLLSGPSAPPPLTVGGPSIQGYDLGET